jgi:hypothetical protein
VSHIERCLPHVRRAQEWNAADEDRWLRWRGAPRPEPRGERESPGLLAEHRERRRGWRPTDLGKPLGAGTLGHVSSAVQRVPTYRHAARVPEVGNTPLTLAVPAPAGRRGGWPRLRLPGRQRLCHGTAQPAPATDHKRDLSPRSQGWSAIRRPLAWIAGPRLSDAAGSGTSIAVC